MALNLCYIELFFLEIPSSLRSISKIFSRILKNLQSFSLSLSLVVIRQDGANDGGRKRWIFSVETRKLARADRIERRVGARVRS